MNESTQSTVTRVNGPIVDAIGLADAQMYEVVEVGPHRLIGEIIRLQGEKGTIQVYENTSGLKPGDGVYPTGVPLSLELGPGLIGNIYDGIQRPLPKIAEHSGAYIRRGEKVPPLDTERTWQFTPSAEVGQRLNPGDIFGTVKETDLIDHRLMLPPDASGTVVEIVPEGEYTIHQTICKLDTGSGIRELTMTQRWPARRFRPFRNRENITVPLVTGMRIIDTFFPIGRGGAAAIPGGFGTGKTMTQHSLAKWSDAQIVVYIGCGERGNEMTEVLVDFPSLVDPRTGKSLMERTILIANTSNMPVAAREVCIYTGITIAEYYRDMGYDVAVMADSTSRWAEALRELSGRLEEMPAEEGFPAYLPSKLAEFYERAGAVTNLNGSTGSVSVIGAVSPPGADFAEPVTSHTKRFIRCFWALDTALANARHYPSIHWLTSYSEYIEDIQQWWEEHDAEWATLRNETIELLQHEERLQQIVKLVGPDVLPDSQRLVLLVADLIKNGFLQQNAFDDVDMFCSPVKQVRLLRLMVELHRRAKQIIEQGAPLVEIRDLQCIPKLVRAKSLIENDDIKRMDALHQEMVRELDALKEKYR